MKLRWRVLQVLLPLLIACLAVTAAGTLLAAADVPRLYRVLGLCWGGFLIAAFGGGCTLLSRTADRGDIRSMDRWHWLAIVFGGLGILTVGAGFMAFAF